MSTPDQDLNSPDVAAPLDQLLTQAALGPGRRLLPGRALLRFAGALAKRPGRVASRAGTLAGELGRIVVGSSDVTPPKRDRRFSDPAWSGNPVLRRIVQAYLVTGQTVEGLVQDVPMEWQDGERVQFAAENLIDFASPSNNPLISPLGWKAAMDTGGANLINGPRALIKDMSSPPRVPSMVDPNAYTVGTDLAVTPGSVVLRTPMFELIQYGAQTEDVRELPLLIIPPTINKYYILDLAPGRSMVEYLVQQGQQVFLVSWRNPDARHSKWGIEAYLEAIAQAFDAMLEITGTPTGHLLGTCSGGIIASITAAQRAAHTGLKRLASLTLLVTMLDQAQGGMIEALIDENVAAAAVAKSRRKGYLDGRSLAEVFAWLRPNDLIWNYWVNNYVQGKPPPKFDILFWNADTTRMAAKLHRDFVDIALHNKLASAGGFTVLDTEIDLSMIHVDSYVVAGSADHICPWMNCYRSSQLLGGKVRFVLSSNGHIAALVNPPSNPKSSHQVSDDNSPDAEEWQHTAPTEKGTWWSDYSRWLGERSGDERPAPEALGSAKHPVVEAAPGSYVLDK